MGYFYNSEFFKFTFLCRIELFKGTDEIHDWPASYEDLDSAHCKLNEHATQDHNLM